MSNLYRQLEVPKELKPEMYPHYMEKDSSFTSTSILGLIYDEVCNYQSQDISRKGKNTKYFPSFL